MSNRQCLLRAVVGVCCLALVAVIGAGGAALGQDKKKEKDPNEGKKGKVIGTLTAKDDKSIEVKADGEEKARKYVPRWVGGAPAKGGGLDKDVLTTIKELKVGSRVEVEWLFQERFRAIAIKLIAPPKADE